AAWRRCWVHASACSLQDAWMSPIAFGGLAVPRSNRSDVGKRRTREHIIADLAVNHVERHVLLAGYTMQRIANDYGLDEIIRTFNPNGEVETGLIWLQIKATDRPRKAKGNGEIAVRLE